MTEKKNNVMTKTAERFRSSSKEMAKPLNLAVTSMLLALSVVLGFAANITMPFLGTNTIKISLSVFPIVAVALLYGPVPAAAAGGLSDIISFMFASTGGAYIPGFTISMILIGIIYGVSFYKEKLTLPRIIVTELIVTIFVNIVLGVLWFKLFYGYSVSAALLTRGLKEIVDVPLSIIIIYFGNKLFVKVPEIRRIIRKSSDTVE